ncbi:hypothetical protein N9137_02145 [Pseudomonadales bacterium]|nr:hypothetical protein [Pseudomonadales bacterium]
MNTNINFTPEWSDPNGDVQEPKGTMYKHRNGKVHATHCNRSRLPKHEHELLNHHGWVYLVKGDGVYMADWIIKVPATKNPVMVTLDVTPDWYDFIDHKKHFNNRGYLMVSNGRKNRKVSFNSLASQIITQRFDSAPKGHITVTVVSERPVKNQGSNGLFIRNIAISGKKPIQESVVTPDGKIDLIDFIMPRHTSPFITHYNWGHNDTIAAQNWQYLTEDDYTYLIKGDEYERFYADKGYVYRDIDTSESPERAYYLRDDLDKLGSAWCPRFMKVGEEFARNPHVTHVNKNTGQILKTGQTKSTIKLLRVYEQDGKQHAVFYAPLFDEEYTYTKGLGMTKWKHKNRMSWWIPEKPTSSLEIGRYNLGQLSTERYYRPQDAPQRPQAAHKVQTFNPYTASLYKAVYTADMRPASEEFDTKGYRHLMGMDKMEELHEFRVKIGDWSNVEQV